MGHIRIDDHPPEPDSIVVEIEGIIHHHNRLDALVAQARNALRETGLLPQDRIWDYLEWRRERDPRRFDHHHPEFVRLFQWEQRDLDPMRHHGTTTGPIAGFASGPTTLVPAVTEPGNPPGVVGAAAPEPSTLTLVLTAMTFGAGLVAARWLRRLPTGGTDASG